MDLTRWMEFLKDFLKDLYYDDYELLRRLVKECFDLNEDETADLMIKDILRGFPKKSPVRNREVIKRCELYKTFCIWYSKEYYKE